GILRPAVLSAAAAKSLRRLNCESVCLEEPFASCIMTAFRSMAVFYMNGSNEESHRQITLLGSSPPLSWKHYPGYAEFPVPSEEQTIAWSSRKRVCSLLLPC